MRRFTTLEPNKSQDFMEPPSPTDLDNTLKTVQIAFYVIGAIVAVLTYRAAKRGLLNTVATEYQKRVMDRLQRLSEDLYSEFDMASPTHWSRTKSVHGAIDHINEVFFRWQDDIFATRRYDYGTPVTPDVQRLSQMLDPRSLHPFQHTGCGCRLGGEPIARDAQHLLQGIRTVC